MVGDGEVIMGDYHLKIGNRERKLASNRLRQEFQAPCKGALDEFGATTDASIREKRFELLDNSR